ncbi:hypothetical protein F66182_11174 [Fusarium sp. NRRL 66182]|nr:hypothetical protein F66182_11174 [Fusarium sp. NRRL 66182]
MRTADIQNWRHKIETTGPECCDALYKFSCLKDSQYRQTLPLSPSDSQNETRKRLMDDGSEPAAKRRRGQDDTDRTPRAPRSQRMRGFPISSDAPGFARDAQAHSVTASQSTQSQASSRSSPSKQLASLEISPRGFEPREFTAEDDRLPRQLRDILDGLQDIKDSAFGIISRNWEEEISSLAKTDHQFSRIRNHMFADPSFRDKFGPTPSPEDARSLATEAADCHVTAQNEAGWNMMVHYPLLSQAVYGSQRQKQLVGVAPCTTAKIIQEYLQSPTQAKMIDFCIYLDPKDNAAEVEEARRILPCGYINHTDFYSLRNRPIALSIETKAASNTPAGSAELQIGTWHSAQWRFLEDLVSRNTGSMDGLPFLPAIIAQGHQWSFAATTRVGQKTVLWLPFQFGSTDDVIGVYKTVLGLQQLCRWVDGVFWPWYKRNALGISEDGDHTP